MFDSDDDVEEIIEALVLLPPKGGRGRLILAEAPIINPDVRSVGAEDAETIEAPVPTAGGEYPRNYTQPNQL